MEKVTATEIMAYAKSKLESGEWGWTQGSFGRDASRKEVPIGFARACSFCVMGSIYKAGADIRVDGWNCKNPSQTLWEMSSHSPTVGDAIALIEDMLAIQIGRAWDWDLTAWNDESSRDKQDIIDLLELAIAECGA